MSTTCIFNPHTGSYCFSIVFVALGVKSPIRLIKIRYFFNCIRKGIEDDEFKLEDSDDTTDNQK